jgi:hypothetical protein
MGVSLNSEMCGEQIAFIRIRKGAFGSYPDPSDFLPISAQGGILVLLEEKAMTLPQSSAAVGGYTDKKGREVFSRPFLVRGAV